MFLRSEDLGGLFRDAFIMIWGFILVAFWASIRFEIDSGIGHPPWRPNGGFMGTSGGRWGIPKSGHPWALRGWDIGYRIGYRITILGVPWDPPK